MPTPQTVDPATSPAQGQWSRLIDGPRCGACAHRAQIVWFAPIWAWGMDGGSAVIVARECGAGCGWRTEADR